MIQETNYIWLVPVIPLLLVIAGIGLILCDLKPGLGLVGLGWLLSVPAIVYLLIKLVTILRGAQPDYSWAQLLGSSILGILVLTEFIWLIVYVKNFKLKLF
ncbi:hypothetical protein [Spirosoma gilvum]